MAPPSPPWGASREPAWSTEQEATPPPRHATSHSIPSRGPCAQGEARVGVMRSRWLGTPASDDRGPRLRWGWGPAQGDLEGAGIKEGAWRPNSPAPTLCLSSPVRAPSPPAHPSGRRESLPPLHGQLEFITTRPPAPLLSLVTSGIQMWKPNRFILKGDQQQGREGAGVCVPQGAGRHSVWRLCRAPSCLAPQPGGIWGTSLGLPGSGGLGCRG